MQILNPTLIRTAIKYSGINEIPGSESNPIILGWAKELGIDYTNDDVPWCSLFMSWVAYKSGYEGIKSLWARDWLNVGAPVTEAGVKRGDIVVLSRDGGGGHVGIVNSIDSDNVYVLGGNQSNAVNIQPYPKSRVLGYRRLNPTLKTKSLKRLVLFSFSVFIITTFIILWQRKA